MVFRYPREEALHRYPSDQARHLTAEAEVFAYAEAEMTLGSAIDVVHVRVGEFPPVAVAGAKGERNLVAGLHCAAMECDLAHDDALEALRGGVEAQRLLHRLIGQGRVCDDAAPGVGMIMQVEREHAHEAR